MTRSRTIQIVYVARALRGFGDGFAAIILPLYLAALGFDPFHIGLVATAALLGSAAGTLLIGTMSKARELRTLLLIGSVLMAATGFLLPLSDHLIWIVLVVFVGTINPSTGDIGVLVPLEHASLAQGVAHEQRTHTFARYSLIGSLATAVGALTAATPTLLVTLGMSQLGAFKAMFFAYGALGVLALALYAAIPIARIDDEQRAAPKPPASVLGPSRSIVFKLAALFSVDAFAGGFVVQSLMALWLFERFDLSLTAASLFFFWSGVLGAFSFPIAAWLAQRVGLINTMVFTHIPSSLCLIVAAFAPDLWSALALLLLRSALSQMDVPTRTSYVMAVVTPPEQAAAASFTAVPRSLASAISPLFAGALLNTAFIGLPLVICGTLKIGYDVALLYSFRHLKPPEESVEV